MRCFGLAALLVLAGCGEPTPRPTAPPSRTGGAGTTADTRPQPPAVAPVPAVAPTPAPVPAPPALAPDPDGRTTCVGDTDCVATNWAGCCSCPQCSVGEPQAYSRDGLRRAEAACAAASCGNQRDCDLGGMCPPGESAANFDPRCRAGRCVLVRR